MSRLSGSILLLAPLLAVGCEPPATSELLYVTFGSGELAPPVEVDTVCSNGGCDGFEQLEAELHFDEHELVEGTAEVEILQYRVEYDIIGFDEGAEGQRVPYYSNATSVTVKVGESSPFNVKAAGQAQRDWVGTRFAVQQVDAIGTLTMAGYDDKNASVIVTTDFDVSFGDFVGGATGTTEDF